jgi:hypothetical protein
MGRIADMLQMCDPKPTLLLTEPFDGSLSISLPKGQWTVVEVVCGSVWYVAMRGTSLFREK